MFLPWLSNSQSFWKIVQDPDNLQHLKPSWHVFSYLSVPGYHWHLRVKYGSRNYTARIVQWKHLSLSEHYTAIWWYIPVGKFVSSILTPWYTNYVDYLKKIPRQSGSFKIIRANAIHTSSSVQRSSARGQAQVTACNATHCTCTHRNGLITCVHVYRWYGLVSHMWCLYLAPWYDTQNHWFIHCTIEVLMRTF